MAGEQVAKKSGREESGGDWEAQRPKGKKGREWEVKSPLLLIFAGNLPVKSWPGPHLLNFWGQGGMFLNVGKG